MLFFQKNFPEHNFKFADKDTEAKKKNDTKKALCVSVPLCLCVETLYLHSSSVDLCPLCRSPKTTWQRKPILSFRVKNLLFS